MLIFSTTYWTDGLVVGYFILDAISLMWRYCYIFKMDKIFLQRDLTMYISEEIGTVIMRFNITWFTQHCCDWGRTQIRDYTHNRHPIPRPSSRASYGLSIVRILKKIDRVVTTSHDVYYIHTAVVFGCVFISIGFNLFYPSMFLQCSAVITLWIFSKILTKYTP